VSAQEGSTTRVIVNRESCRGYGNCLLAAPEMFDLDDDGLVVLRQEYVGEDALGAVQRAIYDCPTDSIVIESPPEPGSE
jgi:ferredoxin